MFKFINCIFRLDIISQVNPANFRNSLMTEKISEETKDTLINKNEKDKIKVLVVNDKKDLLEGVIRNLDNRELFEVETAYSAEQAKNVLKDSCFDVIVSDYELPNGDGLTFLEELTTKTPKKHLILFSEKIETT